MHKRLLFPLLAVVLVSTACTAASVQKNDAGPEIDVRYEPMRPSSAQVALDDEVVEILQSRHYSPLTLNNEFSQNFLNTYLNDLDGAHSLFLASDIEYFHDKYSKGLDEALKSADLTAAFEIYNIYLQRRIQIAEWLLKRVSNGLDELNLKDDESLRLDRSEVAWPEDITARRDLWRRILENQVINMRMNDVSDETIVKRLTRRYESRLKQLRDAEPIDVIDAYMRAYTGMYDPHTSYFTPRRSEDFEIGMNLSLQGIGAQLRTQNGYPEIVRLISGGPAEGSGELEATDRILAVGQGEDGEFVDLGGLTLGEAVQLIRGRKGSIVRLRIRSKDGGNIKTVSLVRDKIELDERDASKRVIDIKRQGRTLQVGIIELPSFYNGVSKDVRKLLGELKAKDVEGVVMDLRHNGGGSLREVTKLIGLFMPSAPSVQIRLANGEVRVRGSSSQDVFYGGPLAVMVNRLSASASEIFAGAIQDYGRGLIMGSRTFGKGTVQVLMPLDSSGRIKFTQAKFYRVSGASTQLRGVMPDIKFPTAIDPDDVGESSLPNALPWDKIDSVSYPNIDIITKLLPELRSRHEQRSERSPAFQYHVKKIKLVKKRNQRKQITLNIEKRRELRKQHHQQMLSLVNAHRKRIGKEPFADYQAYKDADLEDDKAGAYQVETAKILLDLHAMLKTSFKQAAHSVSEGS